MPLQEVQAVALRQFMQGATQAEQILPFTKYPEGQALVQLLFGE